MKTSLSHVSPETTKKLKKKKIKRKQQISRILNKKDKIICLMVKDKPNKKKVQKPPEVQAHIIFNERVK